MRVFSFNRTEEFSCHVAVKPDDRMHFFNINVPKDTTPEVLDAFLNEARLHVYKILDEETTLSMGNGWSSYGD